MRGGTVSVLDGGATSVLANDKAFDIETLTVNTTPISGPNHGALTLAADGAFTYTHDGSETTTDSFTYELTDGSATATATVNIAITPVNDPPVAVDDAATVIEGGTVSILISGATSVLANDTDADLPKDVLLVKTSPISGPNHGSLTLAANGTFTYTHDGSANFTDNFIYELSDGSAANTATVYLDIIPYPDIDFSGASVDLIAAPGEDVSSFFTIGNIGGSFLDWQIEPVMANIIFFEDFESGSLGWTTALVEDGIDDLWHPTTVDNFSPNTSWWSADPFTGDYDTGNQIQNTLISPPIDLTSITGTITLSFFEDYYTEHGWDYVMVDVSLDDGLTWTQLRGFAGPGGTGTAPSGDSNGWIFTSLDLTPFAGQVIRVRFFLDSIDDVFNDFPGWRVDDVAVNTGINLPSWLNRIAPAKRSQGAQNFDLVEFAFSTANLPLGLYTGVVNVISNDIDEPITALPVNLTVAEVPDINVTPIFFNLGLGVGESIPIVTTIENLGANTLNYTIAASESWLVLVSSGGAIAQGASAIDITVNVDAVELIAGFYTGFLTISSDDPNEPEVIVNVNLTVGPPDIFATSSIFADAVSGGASSTFIFIDNFGGEPLNYTIASDSFWLTTDPASGTISPLDFDFVDVPIDASALAPGDFTGILTITSNDPDEPIITTTVDLAVGVSFPDIILENAIRDALGIFFGILTPADMANLTSLTATNLGITDLTGLDTAVNLTFLDLGFNQIRDLSPLLGLTLLGQLWLENNQITDIGALAGLVNLRDDLFVTGAGLRVQNNFINVTPGSAQRMIIDALDAIDGLSVEFEPQNAPVAFDDNATVAEGGTVSVLDNGATSILANDLAIDKDALMVDLISLSGPNHGTLTLAADGTFTYTHDGNENFTDSFVYQLSDGSNTATATVNITILPVNENAPAITRILYSVERRTRNFRQIDPATGLTTSFRTLVGGATNIFSGNGLARHPLTGQLWALFGVSGQEGRELVTINPDTIVATGRGNTGRFFSAMAFDSRGILYGLTGDGDSTPESVFRINTNDATTTFIMALGNGDNGEAIASNPVDGLFYHASGRFPEIFENVDFFSKTVSDIPLSGFAYNEALALTYESVGNLLVSDLSRRLLNLGLNGEATFIGSMDHYAKGLAFTSVDTIAIQDNMTAKPFLGLTIEDIDTSVPALLVVVTLDDPAKGILSALGDFSDDGGGVYSFSGTAAEATAAIQGLTFIPAEGHVSLGQTESTILTLVVDDGTASAVSNSKTVLTTAVEDSPVLLSLPETSANSSEPYGYDFFAFDVDPAETLIITAPTLPGWLSFLDNGDGTASLTGTPTSDDVAVNNVSLVVTNSVTENSTTQDFAITVVFVNHQPSVGNTLNLYSVSRDDDKLRIIDPADGSTISDVTMTLSTGETINTVNGLATHPFTGDLWAIFDIFGCCGEPRLLAVVNPDTGVATTIGNTGDGFAGIAFDENGTLFGVTGDGATNDEQLYILDQTDATATLFRGCPKNIKIL